MTPQELEESGYIRYQSETYRHLKSTDTLYQKRINDEIGVRYFIDLWAYVTGDHISYQPEVVFYDINNSARFEVTLYDASYISIIENDFEEIWNKMGCGYYERYYCRR